MSIGIGMLIFALIVSALMGIYQETLYEKYGKHPDEALFYSVKIKNMNKKILDLIYFFPFSIIFLYLCLHVLVKIFIIMLNYSINPSKFCFFH